MNKKEENQKSQILLSCIILAKNEEARIGKAITSASFADEVLIIDDESTDKTVMIAKKLGADVCIHNKSNFSEQRNFGLQKARGEWVLYLDADEVISSELQQEIQAAVANNDDNTIVAYKIPRKNYYLGKPWPHKEKLERLFKKKSLKQWYGVVHESPNVIGVVGELSNNIIHHTHRSLSEMVIKTNQWSAIEAQLRFEAKHPMISWWRFPRLMITTFFDWYIRQGGWKVGTVGIIESVYQSFSIFITYAKLWELQHAS